MSDDEKITKTYKLLVNGQDIEVDAATLAVSEKRVKRYLKKLMRVSKEQTHSNRAFWADIIMFNILTDKIIKKASPFVIENAVAPLELKKKTSEEVKSVFDNVRSSYEKALSDEYMYGDELFKEDDETGEGDDYI